MEEKVKMDDKMCGTCIFYKGGMCTVPLWVNADKVINQMVLETNFCHLWEKKEEEK